MSNSWKNTWQQTPDTLSLSKGHVDVWLCDLKHYQVILIIFIPSFQRTSVTVRTNSRSRIKSINILLPGVYYDKDLVYSRILIRKILCLIILNMENLF